MLSNGSRSNDCLWPVFTVRGPGRGVGNLNGIVNLHAEVAHGAVDGRVAQQELDRTEIAGSPIDQSRLALAPPEIAMFRR
jgi:hypothetical protein